MKLKYANFSDQFHQKQKHLDLPAAEVRNLGTLRKAENIYEKIPLKNLT